jgi:hypothetical protein
MPLQSVHQANMNPETTPLNPLSLSATAAVSASYQGPESLGDMIREYGAISFRNGFGIGFVTGASVVVLIVAALQKA